MAIKTFGFLDESGNLSTNHPDNYFAVGAIFHPWPDELIIQLHRVFENLCSSLRKDATRLELKFNEVTNGTINYYVDAIDLLEADHDWRFCSLIVDKLDPKYIKPIDKLQQWECYLRYVKLLLNHNIQQHERMTLLADFLRRPTGDVHSFATLPMVVNGLDDVLQVESQGILLVQLADVLLGSTMYKGRDVTKIKLYERIVRLRSVVGKKRFNEWKMIWK